MRFMTGCGVVSQGIQQRRGLQADFGFLAVIAYALALSMWMGYHKGADALHFVTPKLSKLSILQNNPPGSARG